MTTITINGFIHAQKAQFSDAVTYQFMTSKDMSEYGYMLICPHDMTFTIPAEFNPVAAEVSILEKKKDKLADEYHGAVRQINDRISSLLCIGHTVEVGDDSAPL